ncbi:MAG: hypothetical protein AB7O59_06710 [Pirellulales bacterium]
MSDEPTKVPRPKFPRWGYWAIGAVAVLLFFGCVLGPILAYLLLPEVVPPQ